jgi:hypothetical protein
MAKPVELLDKLLIEDQVLTIISIEELGYTTKLDLRYDITGDLYLNYDLRDFLDMVSQGKIILFSKNNRNIINLLYN